jgi:hypothetical protein
VSDIERAVERVYDVLPPLAATIVGDVINGATVTGRVLPQHVQQTLAAEVLGMVPAMPTSEWPTDEQWERVVTGYDPAEVETVARTLDVACGLGYHDRDMAEHFPRLDWPEGTGEDGKDYWRTVARAAIAALEQHRAGGVS